MATPTGALPLVDEPTVARVTTPVASGTSDLRSTPEPPGRRPRRWVLPVVIVSGLAVLVTVVIAVFVLATPKPTTVVVEAADDASTSGHFVAAPGAVETDAVGALRSPTTLNAKPHSASDGLALQSAAGDFAGLYATVDAVAADANDTGDSADSDDAAQPAPAVCDVAVIGQALEAKSATARIWTDTVGGGTTPSDTLTDFTPVLLGQDTAVTEYKIVSGKAVSYQAILQAGTAVMIDNQAQPRVRCASGNPLAPPTIGGASGTAGKAKLTGAKWSWFSLNNVVVITAATNAPLDELNAVYDTTASSLVPIELVGSSGTTS